MCTAVVAGTLFLTVVLTSTSATANTGIAHQRFEYKYSFKGPYLSQKDGSVPFWEYSGSTIASEEMVRITPSLRSKKGAIWTRNPINFKWWQIELVFRVNGRGRLGADGLAFWFTQAKMPEGNTFGSSDTWNGLGVFFDSFDNDNRNNNPYIMAMLNDGTKKYDHETDGISQQLAGCQRDFRNKPFPVKTKVVYFENVLEVHFHSGNTNTDDDYELCLRAENVFLPVNGFFGVSAATGGLADDHDVLKFLTSSLYAAGQGPQMHANIADPEKEKFSKEYEQYKAKLEHQKEEYRKLHPEQQAQIDQHGDPEHAYESQQNQELRQVFEGQSHIYEGLKAVHRKLDEVLGRQERTLSMVTMVQQQAAGVHPVGVPAQQQQFHQPQPGVVLPIQRHEVDSILAAQRDIVATLGILRTSLAEVAQRAGQGTASGGGSIDARLMSEMRDSLNIVKRDVASMSAATLNRAQPLTGCPQPACVGTATFVAFTCIQLILVLGYMIYRNSKADAAKKFY